MATLISAIDKSGGDHDFLQTDQGTFWLPSKSFIPAAGLQNLPTKTMSIRDLENLGPKNTVGIGLNAVKDPTHMRSLAGMTGTVGAAGQSDLLTQQAGREEEFLGRYRGAIAGQEGLPSISARVGEELGLPQQREVVGGLRGEAVGLGGMLSTLPERMKTETRGFDVTATQLARMGEERRIPLSRQLTEATRGLEVEGAKLGASEAELGRRMGLETAEQQKQMLPFALEADQISARTAREVTMYTSERERELSTLLQQMQIQGALDASSMAQLNNLALQEHAFANTLEQLKATGGTMAGQKELMKFGTEQNIRQTLATRTGSGGYGTTDTQNQGLIELEAAS